MGNSVASNQSAENGKCVDPNQTIPENDSVDIDLDLTAQNGK